MILIVVNGIIFRVVTSCGRVFSLHLIVLTVSGYKVRFELGPGFSDGMFLVPPTTCTHEVICCKYFCITNVDLLRVANEDAPCFIIVGTIWNLLEEGLNQLLWIPSPAHVFKSDLEVDHSDVSVSLEEVIQHVSCRDVGVGDHVVIQYVQIHWFKHTDDLLLQRLLHGGVCRVSLNILLPNVASGADLGRCSIRVGWCPPGGLWACPKYWSGVRCWSYHCIGSIRDDEARVSQGAAAQVCADCPRVPLKKLPCGTDCLVIRLALNCWEYWVREACDGFLDGGLLHIDVLGGPECLFALLMRKRFWSGVPKKTVVLIAGYSLG
jgi:hypothetical protein